MYILIEKKKLKADSRFHERMPDGRLILPFSALRTLGTVTDVDIIGSATELKRLIAAQQEAGITPPPDAVLNAVFTLVGIPCTDDVHIVSTR